MAWGRHKGHKEASDVNADMWNTPAGKALRLRCFYRDRDNDERCCWCHDRIDYSLGPYTRGGNVWAWSPEHKKPRKKYPWLALEPTNIVAAHFHCNASRKDKAGIDPLGTPSREW